MKSNKNLTEPHNVKKAQVNVSPELSCTQKEFKNGVDLQPLDDLPESEFIEFKYDVVNDTQEDISPQINEPKNEKVSNKKASFIRVAIAVVCLAAAFVGIYLSFFHSDDFTHCVVAVYEQGSNINIKLENNDIISLENVDKLSLSENGKILTYTQDTESKTGKYDIRFIDFTKRSSVKNQGSIVVSGIESDWSMDKTGSFIYYSQNENGSEKYYAFSTEKSESQLLVANASEVYTPPKGDIVYFTREKDSGSSLHRIRFGEEAEVLGNVSNIKAVADSDNLEFFYTVESEDVTNHSYSLYKISGDKAALKIADDVSEVYLDDYQIGGNLYYFVKNEAKLNWNNFISDNYAEADSNAKLPSKDDYMKTVGFFFKRDVLDTVAYNNAMQNYKKSQIRQEIREELNKLDLDLAVPAEYKLKVYDTNISKELASSVKLENIVAFAKTGAPRAIYKASNIKSDKILDIDALYTIAVNESVERAMHFVVAALNSDYEISTSYEYSWYDGNKVLTYDFAPDYDVKKADIQFAGRDKIVAKVPTSDTKSKLCFNLVQDKKIGETVEICDNVADFRAESSNVYYTVPNGDLGNLYEYSSADNQKLLCQNNVNYFINDDESLVLLEGIYTDNTLTSMNIHLYKDGEITLISENVHLNSFNYSLKNNAFSFIKNYKSAAATDTNATVGGELIIYCNSKSEKVDENVVSIQSINYAELTK